MSRVTTNVSQASRSRRSTLVAITAAIIGIIYGYDLGNISGALAGNTLHSSPGKLLSNPSRRYFQPHWGTMLAIWGRMPSPEEGKDDPSAQVSVWNIAEGKEVRRLRCGGPLEAGDGARGHRVRQSAAN